LLINNKSFGKVVLFYTKKTVTIYNNTNAINIIKQLNVFGYYQS